MDLSQPVQGIEMVDMLVAIFSAVGTSVIFNDVKSVTNGLLHHPVAKFMILYAFCFTVLKGKVPDAKIKAMYGAWCVMIVYILLLSISKRFPETVAGKNKEKKSIV